MRIFEHCLVKELENKSSYTGVCAYLIFVRSFIICFIFFFVSTEIQWRFQIVFSSIVDIAIVQQCKVRGSAINTIV